MFGRSAESVLLELIDGLRSGTLTLPPTAGPELPLSRPVVEAPEEDGPEDDERPEDKGLPEDFSVQDPSEEDRQRGQGLRLTRASSYALHAVAYLASQKEKDRPVASHQIAQARSIPERFLLKVLKPLVSARILLAIKGPSGGYCLARNPGDITMLEILEAVDGVIRGQAPVPLTDAGDSQLNSKLAKICKASTDQVREQLEKVRVSELIDRS